MARFLCLLPRSSDVATVPMWAVDVEIDRIVSRHVWATVTDDVVNVCDRPPSPWHLVVGLTFPDGAPNPPGVDEVAAETGADAALQVNRRVLMAGPRNPGSTKIIGLLRRSPRLTIAQFESHWRDVHAPIAMGGGPSFVRYAMSIVQHASGAFAWDGVTEQWFPTADALTDHVARRQDGSASAADMPKFLSEVVLFVAESIR